MKRYKIVVAYDGTDFHGWQIQPRDVTIVSILQESFQAAFSKDISILGASRTDAGVHALGQVAVCKTELAIGLQQLCMAWNNSLPSAIVIRLIEEVNEYFHIFADVLSKTYWYYLFLERPLPFSARYGWYWRFISKVDWKIFCKVLQCFVGEHDFRSFCKCESEELENSGTTVRTIDEITVHFLKQIDFCDKESMNVSVNGNEAKVVRIAITGKGFLRYQIRRMIGAALTVACKNSCDEAVKFIQYQLKHPSDQQELTKAEGCGLWLQKIVYK